MDVKFEVDYTSNYPHFLFDTGMDVGVLARAFAREKWNRQFFENLKRLICCDSSIVFYTVCLGRIKRITSKWDNLMAVWW